MTHSPTPHADGQPRPTKPAPTQVAAVHSEVAAVHTQVAAVHSEVVASPSDKVGALHTEVAALHTEVGELHTEVSDLHTEVADFPAELQALQDKVDHLDRALDSSRDISAAVGIVMERLRLTQEEAFQVLVNSSQKRNIKLRQVADEIVEAGSLPAGVRPTKADPGGM